MPSREEKKELDRRLNELKKDIRELKAELNQINDQKESWFEKKEEQGQAISKAIGDVRNSKESRNQLTGKVRQSKKERENINIEVKKKIEEVKKLRAEKDSIAKKHGIEEDPSQIKKEIDNLEMKIETEVMSFDAEQKIVKIIKSLKKNLEEARKVSDVWEKIDKSSKEIDNLKKKAEDSHKKVQNQAKTSQEKHERMIEASGEIDDMKAKEEEAFKKFIELKKKFGEVNDKLKDKLVELNEVNQKLSRFKEASKKDREEKTNKKISEQIKDVEDKIKNKQKLTTEDLLVMQQAAVGVEEKVKPAKSKKKAA